MVCEDADRAAMGEAAMTRTLTETFAYAIQNAQRINYLHPRIQREVDAKAKARQIECCFRAGRINGSDKELLFDVYVRDA